MPRKRQEFCPNCKGTNEKCKYLINGKICTKGKNKGKAIGKAKGKAISDKTLDKRAEYDSLLGNYHTEYKNAMYNNALFTWYENGKLFSTEHVGKIYSFERYLNNKGEKTLASWARDNYKERLQYFNVHGSETDGDAIARMIYNFKYGKKDKWLRNKLDKETPLTEEEIEIIIEKEEKVKMEIVRTQTNLEAIETAQKIEEKLKECDKNKLTDEEALKEISDLANEIDLSYFNRLTNEK